MLRRLTGLHGEKVKEIVNYAREGELTRVPGTDTLWAELRWAAHAEAVVHLDDLLFRRSNLGITLQKGGMAFFDYIQTICQDELGWDTNRWEREANNFKALWRKCYSVPG